MTQIYANNFTTLVLGRRGENLARKVVFDIRDLESLYGTGDVEVIYQRPSDAQPYPLAVQRDGTLVTWDVTATDTEMSDGSGKCELRYYVGETIVKSKTWQTWVEPAMDTPSETAPPEPEQGWVDQIISVGAAAKASAEAAKADADRAAALASEVSKKAAQTAQDASDAAKAMEAAQTAQRLAEEAQSAAEAARTAAETAQAAAEQSATDAAGAKQDAETALKSAQDAAAAAAQALADIRALYQEMQTWAQGVIQDVNAAGSTAVQSVQSAGDTQVQRVTDEGTTQTANAKAQADAAAQSAAGAAQSAQEAAESAAVYGDVVADVNQLKQDIVDCHYIEKDISGSVVIVDSNVINPVLSAKDNITVLHTGKNLVSVPYDDPSGVSYNVTFTVSENGIFNVNGTATGTAVHNLVKSNQPYRRSIKAGTYTLSGCPAGGGNDVYMLTIGITGVGEFNDFGDGVTFNVDNDTTYYLKFKVYNGITVDFDVKAQLEMSSEKTDWEQYRHENISVGLIPVRVSLYSGTNVFTADSVFNLSVKVKKGKPPIIDLREYATGDGETDDTNAINEALDKATHGILYVPKGTYLFSRTLHIHSGTKVIGFGSDSVFKLSSNFDLDAISWRPDIYNALYKYPMIALDEDSTGCELRNFALVGQNINWKDENEDGIMVRGSNHVLENLIIHDLNYSNENFTSRWCLCPAWGIDIFKANTISVRYCHVYNCGYENIGTEESETVTISGCKFGDACQTSTQIHRLSKHIKFYGNTVYHTENIRSENCPAFTMDASIGVDMDDIVVSNSTFGSHVNTVAGGENNIKIIGNHIDGIMYTNTTEYYGQGLMICNNHINGRINMRADNVIVSNNIINNDTEMPMARIYGNSVEINGNLGIGIGKTTTIVEH